MLLRSQTRQLEQRNLNVHDSTPTSDQAEALTTSTKPSKKQSRAKKARHTNPGSQPSQQLPQTTAKHAPDVAEHAQQAPGTSRILQLPNETLFQIACLLYNPRKDLTGWRIKIVNSPDIFNFRLSCNIFSRIGLQVFHEHERTIKPSKPLKNCVNPSELPYKPRESLTNVTYDFSLQARNTIGAVLSNELLSRFIEKIQFRIPPFKSYKNFMILDPELAISWSSSNDFPEAATEERYIPIDEIEVGNATMLDRDPFSLGVLDEEKSSVDVLHLIQTGTLKVQDAKSEIHYFGVRSLREQLDVFDTAHSSLIRLTVLDGNVFGMHENLILPACSIFSRLTKLSLTWRDRQWGGAQNLGKCWKELMSNAKSLCYLALHSGLGAYGLDGPQGAEAMLTGFLLSALDSILLNHVEVHGFELSFGNWQKFTTRHKDTLKVIVLKDVSIIKDAFMKFVEMMRTELDLSVAKINVRRSPKSMAEYTAFLKERDATESTGEEILEKYITKHIS